MERANGTKSPRRKPGGMVYANPRHRAAVRLAGLRPMVSTRPSRPGAHTKSPRRKPGGMVYANPRRRAAVRLAGLRPMVSTRPSRPGAHTKSPRRKPGDSGLHAFLRAMRCGLEPGNQVPSCNMDGGVVFVPGVPGLPPGAFWNGDGADSLFARSSKHGSHLDSCSGSGRRSAAALRARRCEQPARRGTPRLPSAEPRLRGP